MFFLSSSFSSAPAAPGICVFLRENDILISETFNGDFSCRTKTSRQVVGAISCHMKTSRRVVGGFSRHMKTFGRVVGGFSGRKKSVRRVVGTFSCRKKTLRRVVGEFLGRKKTLRNIVARNSGGKKICRRSFASLSCDLISAGSKVAENRDDLPLCRNKNASSSGGMAEWFFLFAGLERDRGNGRFYFGTPAGGLGWSQTRFPYGPL